LKGREIDNFLPLQGGGQEGDGGLQAWYKYVFSIMDSLVKTLDSSFRWNDEITNL
jgi:hypothetical protein